MICSVLVTLHDRENNSQTLVSDNAIESHRLPALTESLVGVHVADGNHRMLLLEPHTVSDGPTGIFPSFPIEYNRGLLVLERS